MSVKKIQIKAPGYHDMFSVSTGGLENLTVLEINEKTIVIEAPAHITATMPNVIIESASVLTKVDALIITHSDADHIAGLDSLIWHKLFGENSRLLLITHKEVAKQLWQRISTAFETDRVDGKTPRDFDHYVEFIELKLGETTYINHLGIKIESFKRSTKHAPFLSIAFRVLQKGTLLIAYSGDTSFDPELIEFLVKGENHPVIHEVGSYTVGSTSHTHIEELLTLPKDIQARMFINHIPISLEEMIRRRIKEEKSPIRFANELKNIKMKRK